MSLRPVSAVVFDLDGTLCYYGVSVAEAIGESLRRAGEPHDRLGDLDVAAERFDALWGEVEPEDGSVRALQEGMWACLLAEHGITDLPFARRCASIYVQIRGPSITLFDGARELLLELRQTYRVGLLTNGPSDMQWPKIERLEIASLFDTIVVAGDVGIHKPDGRVFEILLELLKVTAQEAVYVGNSMPIDIVGAKGVGMQAVWVNGRDAHAPAEAPTAVPDAELASVDALQEVLP